MGVPWLLPCSQAVPSACHHTNSVDCPLSGRGQGEVEKPQWDMAFPIIVPSTNARGDQVFSLAVVWANPHQGHLSTLVEAAQKLMLLADDAAQTGHMHLSTWMTPCHMHPCPIRDTLVVWWMAYTLQMPAVGSTSYKCGSCCNTVTVWCSQRD